MQMNKLMRLARESADIPEEGSLDNPDDNTQKPDPAVPPEALPPANPSEPADPDTPPVDETAATGDAPPPSNPPAEGDAPAAGDTPPADTPAATPPAADGVPTNTPAGDDTSLPLKDGPGADEPITDDLDAEEEQFETEQASSDINALQSADVELDKIQITLENLYEQVSSGEVDASSQDIIASTLNDISSNMGVDDMSVAAVEAIDSWKPGTLRAIERLQDNVFAARKRCSESFMDKIKSVLGSVEADIRLAQKKIDEATRRLQSQDTQIKIDTSKISSCFTYAAKGNEELVLMSTFSRAPAMTTLFCDAASGFISGEIKLDADLKTMMAPWDRYYDVMETGPNGFAIDLFMGTGKRPLFGYFTRYEQGGPAFWHFEAKGTAKPRAVEDTVFEVSSRELVKMLGSMRRLSNDLARALTWLKRVEQISNNNIAHLAITNRRQELTFEVTVNRMASTALQLVRASIASMNQLADVGA